MTMALSVWQELNYADYCSIVVVAVVTEILLIIL